MMIHVVAVGFVDVLDNNVQCCRRSLCWIKFLASRVRRPDMFRCQFWSGVGGRGGGGGAHRGGNRRFAPAWSLDRAPSRLSILCVGVLNSFPAPDCILLVVEF